MLLSWLMCGARPPAHKTLRLLLEGWAICRTGGRRHILAGWVSSMDLHPPLLPCPQPLALLQACLGPALGLADPADRLPGSPALTETLRPALAPCPWALGTVTLESCLGRGGLREPTHTP